MFRSLRWRLQAWHTLILLLVVAGLEGMLYAEARGPGSTRSTPSCWRRACDRRGASNNVPAGSLPRRSAVGPRSTMAGRPRKSAVAPATVVSAGPGWPPPGEPGPFDGPPPATRPA